MRTTAEDYMQKINSLIHNMTVIYTD